MEMDLVFAYRKRILRPTGSLTPLLSPKSPSYHANFNYLDLSARESAYRHNYRRYDQDEHDDKPPPLTLRDFKILRNVLANNCSLLEIKLSRSSVGNEGAILLSHGLKINDTLLSIDLSRNEIEDEGALFLAFALRENKTLLRVDLSQNPINTRKWASFVRDAVFSNINYKVVVQGCLFNKQNLCILGTEQAGKTALLASFLGMEGVMDLESFINHEDPAVAVRSRGAPEAKVQQWNVEARIGDTYWVDTKEFELLRLVSNTVDFNAKIVSTSRKRCHSRNSTSRSDRHEMAVFPDRPVPTLRRAKEVPNKVKNRRSNRRSKARSVRRSKDRTSTQRSEKAISRMSVKSITSKVSGKSGKLKTSTQDNSQTSLSSVNTTTSIPRRAKLSSMGDIRDVLPFEGRFSMKREDNSDPETGVQDKAGNLATDMLRKRHAQKVNLGGVQYYVHNDSSPNSRWSAKRQTRQTLRRSARRQGIDPMKARLYNSLEGNHVVDEATDERGFNLAFSSNENSDSSQAPGLAQMHESNQIRPYTSEEEAEGENEDSLEVLKLTCDVNCDKGVEWSKKQILGPGFIKARAKGQKKRKVSSNDEESEPVSTLSTKQQKKKKKAERKPQVAGATLAFRGDRLNFTVTEVSCCSHLAHLPEIILPKRASAFVYVFSLTERHRSLVDMKRTLLPILTRQSAQTGCRSKVLLVGTYLDELDEATSHSRQKLLLLFDEIIRRLFKKFIKAKVLVKNESSRLHFFPVSNETQEGIPNVQRVIEKLGWNDFRNLRPIPMSWAKSFLSLQYKQMFRQKHSFIPLARLVKMFKTRYGMKSKVELQNLLEYFSARGFIKYDAETESQFVILSMQYLLNLLGKLLMPKMKLCNDLSTIVKLKKFKMIREATRFKQHGIVSQDLVHYLLEEEPEINSSFIMFFLRFMEKNLLIHRWSWRRLLIPSTTTSEVEDVVNTLNSFTEKEVFFLPTYSCKTGPKAYISNFVKNRKLQEETATKGEEPDQKTGETQDTSDFSVCEFEFGHAMLTPAVFHSVVSGLICTKNSHSMTSDDLTDRGLSQSNTRLNTRSDTRKLSKLEAFNQTRISIGRSRRTTSVADVISYVQSLNFNDSSATATEATDGVSDSSPSSNVNGTSKVSTLIHARNHSEYNKVTRRSAQRFRRDSKEVKNSKRISKMRQVEPDAFTENFQKVLNQNKSNLKGPNKGGLTLQKVKASLAANGARVSNSSRVRFQSTTTTTPATQATQPTRASIASNCTTNTIHHRPSFESSQSETLETGTNSYSHVYSSLPFQSLTLGSGVTVSTRQESKLLNNLDVFYDLEKLNVKIYKNVAHLWIGCENEVLLVCLPSKARNADVLRVYVRSRRLAREYLNLIRNSLEYLKEYFWMNLENKALSWKLGLQISPNKGTFLDYEHSKNWFEVLKSCLETDHKGEAASAKSATSAASQVEHIVERFAEISRRRHLKKSIYGDIVSGEETAAAAADYRQTNREELQVHYKTLEPWMPKEETYALLKKELDSFMVN